MYNKHVRCVTKRKELHKLRKTACVTGAASGLGYSLAEALVKKGYLVFAGYHTRLKPDLARLGEAYPEQVVIGRLDISDLESVKAFKSVILSKTDHLDLMLNNAGILGVYDQTIFDDIDYDSIRHVIETNTFGPLRTINQYLDLILKSEDKLIINISSTDASIADCWRKDSFAYCISKAGLNVMTAIVANGLSDYGVKVLAIHPGWLRTYMCGEIDAEADMEPEEAAEKIMKLIDRKDEFPFTPLNYIDNNGNPMRY